MDEGWAMQMVGEVATVASVTVAERVQEVMAKVAAVEACAARVDCMAVESVVATHVTKVGERAPEATEKEVGAEGEMARQRVVEAREVAARVVATEVAAATTATAAAAAAARAVGAMAMAAAVMAAAAMAVAAMAMAEAAMAAAAELAAAAGLVAAAERAVSVTVAERVQEVLARAVVVVEEMVQETLEAG